MGKTPAWSFWSQCVPAVTHFTVFLYDTKKPPDDAHFVLVLYVFVAENYSAFRIIVQKI